MNETTPAGGPVATLPSTPLPPSAWQTPSGWGQPPPPPRSRSWVVVCVAVVAVVIALGALAAGRTAGRAQPPAAARPAAPGTGASAPACAPSPCAVDAGFTVRISSVDRNAPLGRIWRPQAGDHIVTLQIAYQNGGAGYRAANEFQFQLVDATGLKRGPVVLSDAPGCGGWTALQVPAGGGYGPKPLCFEASGPVDGPLTLTWAPNWISETDISLP